MVMGIELRNFNRIQFDTVSEVKQEKESDKPTWSIYSYWIPEISTSVMPRADRPGSGGRER